MQRRNSVVGFGLGCAVLALYITTLAPTVLEADSGEFQFVAWLPGIAHPTGYPLYIMLGWLWTHIVPWGEVAWRMNLLSAVLAACTVSVMYGVSLSLLHKLWPDNPPAVPTLGAALTALTFGLGETFWSQAVVAEVYTLNSLLVVLVLGLALRRSDYGLAFIFGLSLTHHRTMVLLLPGLVLWQLKTGLFMRRRVPGYMLLAIAPLLLYLYLPLAATWTPYATLSLSDRQTLTLYDNSVGGFLAHVTGTAFGGELRLTVSGERLALVGQLLVRQFTWSGVALAGIGLMVLWQRYRDFCLLTAVSVLAYVGFNLIYVIGDVYVLFIPVWLMVSLWLGVGSVYLADAVARRFVAAKTYPTDTPVVSHLNARLSQEAYRWVAPGVVAIWGVLPLWLLFTRYEPVNQSQNVAAQAQWQAILAQPLPAGAVLVSNDRNEIMPLWYYQYVEGQRPDVQGLFPHIVPAYATIGRVLDAAFQSERPVYLIKPMPGLNIKADLTGGDSLYRAQPFEPPLSASPTPLPPITLESGQVESMALLGYEVTPDPNLTVTLYWQVTQPLSVDYTSYVHVLDATGTRIAQSDHRPGGMFYGSQHWHVGEVLRDAHTLAMPQPGLYHLRVGMYYHSAAGVLYGNGLDLGSFEAMNNGTHP